MDYNEIDLILSSVLEREIDVLDKPQKEEWSELSSTLKYNFPNEFKYFIELMCQWSFPGDIYNVSKRKNNGNDMIDNVYFYEIDNGLWDEDMIPFYGIGNGDYFCLCRTNSKVYYFYEDKAEFIVESDSFVNWIKNLPNFLKE